MADYAAAYQGFSGSAALANPNIAALAMARHATGPRAHQIAIQWLGKRGARRAIQYGELAELEIDSMDLLHFAVGIHEQTGIDIPEADYPKLTPLESCLSYLERRGA